ncbi:hypothetical protein WJX81_002849 [Elliptochloris bilobata]|uniref:SHSP domain-containing protein n=1 Tax=Elliptochloris bilobata TaxID=381761 RepID=A0AAW1QVI1_9CHLO
MQAVWAVLGPSGPDELPGSCAWHGRALDNELNSLARFFDFPGLDIERDTTTSSVAPLPGIGLGAVDIQETPNAYLFKVDVPGLSKDDVKVRVTRDGVLVIEGERKQEEEKEENGFKRYERVYGQFVRRFRLPDNVDATKIRAKTENGVLMIEVPKTEEHDKPHHDVNIE